ncbi:hypothetical protein [Microvirga arsenatis]|uniref:Uncharacterized protein n=1 Tax=Microvirga arsenatis TaxID=2692265 RepID=A0ABW9YVL5_9HYPH|nr:hypothetical protein [Microvirga arsenatis]NBJ13319.1 hypothetical protein [Microvirga arsenatis]NBJ24103.1 hypothetical protein [Microvirga arsenatis]
MTERVIDLEALRERRIEETWAQYCAARMQAEATLSVEDGIAAGKAWRRWLDLFMSGDQRESLDRAGEVKSLQRRAG